MEPHETTEFVDKYYVMNPDTDEVLLSGSELKNGMVVLIEDPKRRVLLSAVSSDADISFKALLTNRWCTVTKLGAIEDHVMFVGVYPDGTKFARYYPPYASWLVKKISLVKIKADEVENQQKLPLKDLQPKEPIFQLGKLDPNLPESGTSSWGKYPEKKLVEEPKGAPEIEPAQQDTTGDVVSIDPPE